MCKILMLGGTGVIGESILRVLGDNEQYAVTITSRKNRISKYNNVRYILGNANDLDFISTIADDSYDVLIDFMNYRNDNLERNIQKLVRIAKQYIFLSSARVYDNSQEIINEKCSLLFDTTDDIEFRNSGTYAVKKAYQERYVKGIGGNKVTIVRPYKTFSANRLQLGEYEIKHWLRRIVGGKAIVLNQDILDKNTALTQGEDVARGIISLFNVPEAYGEIYQIATDDYMTWGNVLKIYVDVLKTKGFNPVVYIAKNTEKIDLLFECGYHMPYDIKMGRRFRSEKINEISPICYKAMAQGLKEALLQSLDQEVVWDYDTPDIIEYDRIVDEFIETEEISLFKL